MESERLKQVTEFLEKEVEKKIASKYKSEADALKERRQKLEDLIKELEDTDDNFVKEMNELGWDFKKSPKSDYIKFRSSNDYFYGEVSDKVYAAEAIIRKWPVQRAKLNKKLIQRLKTLKAIEAGDKEYNLAFKFYTDIKTLRSIRNRMNVDKLIEDEDAFYKKMAGEVVNENITSPEIEDLIDDVMFDVVKIGKGYKAARLSEKPFEKDIFNRAYNHILDMMIRVEAKDRNKHFTKDIKKLLAKEAGVTSVKATPRAEVKTEAKEEAEELERE